MNEHVSLLFLNFLPYFCIRLYNTVSCNSWATLTTFHQNNHPTAYSRLVYYLHLLPVVPWKPSHKVITEMCPPVMPHYQIGILSEFWVVLIHFVQLYCWQVVCWYGRTNDSTVHRLVWVYRIPIPMWY